METKKIGELCSISKKSVMPKEGVTYTLYSLPSYDKDMTPETLLGEEIKSLKFALTDNTILYNKLNVHFKRIWNVGKLSTANNICSTEFFPLKVKGKNVCQDYLYYVLRDDTLTQAMYGARRGTSGSQQRIAPETLLEYEVPFFPIEEQKKIAALLKDLDDRIFANRMIKENLTQQARALFQSWFIDFEPFGGSMPLDWKKVTIGDIATIQTRVFSPEKNPDVIIEHYSIPAVDSIHYPVFEKASEVKSNKYLLTDQSVMISKLNPDTKRIWRPLCLSEYPVCSTEFIVYEANEALYKDFLFSIIDSTPFFHHLCAHTTGSTNSRQRAIPKSTLEFVIPLPPENVVREFCDIVTPMYDMAVSRDAENQSLVQARDTLLPNLISGKIDITHLTE